MPILLQPCGAVPKGTAPFYRLITDARFANKFYMDWGVTYTTAAQLSSTLNRCDFHFSIDISDAYHLSFWAGCSGELRPVQRPVIVSNGPGQPSEVSWVDAMVNGCTPSTCRGGYNKDLSGIMIDGFVFRFAACQFGQKTADMNPRSFGAKRNNVTTYKIPSLAANLTSSFICVRLNSTSSSTMHFMCQSSLIRFSSQSGPGVFEWNGRPFHQAQPQIATWILHTVSHRSKGHNHRLLSALLHGPIITACIRLADVLRDQDFLAGTPAELSLAHHSFSAQFFTSAVHASSGDVAPVLEISDDQMIALGDQIFELCARLKMIKDDEYLTKLLEPSLTVLQKRHDAWTSLRNSPSLREGDPHLTQPLARDASGQFSSQIS
jgi:hypothetical protein